MLLFKHNSMTHFSLSVLYLVLVLCAFCVNVRAQNDDESSDIEPENGDITVTSTETSDIDVAPVSPPFTLPLSTTTTTTTTTTHRPASKNNKQQHRPASSSSSASSSHRSKNKNRRRKNDRHPQNLAGSVSSLEFVPDPSEVKPEQTCLIGDVCMRNGKLGYCYKPHEPIHYDRDARETEDFYEMMQESCSHFFDDNENLKHPLCCSAEQEETIARLNANIDLIRKSCPSCLLNVKRLFCNILCAPNQRDFLRVERVKGETVMEVTMAISEQFVSKFFSSCRDVRVFGAYLLDFDYGCGKHRRANCTAVEFIESLGNLSEIPFNFKPLIVDSTSAPSPPTVPKSDSNWPVAVMNDTAYECFEAPPNEMPCHCDHCPRSCSADQRQSALLKLSSSKHHKSSPSSHSTTSNRNFNRRSSSSACSLLLNSLHPIIIMLVSSSLILRTLI